MAYNKTTWANGDVVTASKLNNIEEQILANESAINDVAEQLELLSVIDEEEF